MRQFEKVLNHVDILLWIDSNLIALLKKVRANNPNSRRAPYCHLITMKWPLMEHSRVVTTLITHTAYIRIAENENNFICHDREISPFGLCLVWFSVFVCLPATLSSVSSAFALRHCSIFLFWFVFCSPLCLSLLFISLLYMPLFLSPCHFLVPLCLLPKSVSPEFP